MNIIYCNNCGNEGHLYRHCKLPVLSYGVLLFTHDKKLLMIQRKDSISYIEFLRGKYKLEDKDYILKLLNCCSISEVELLRTLSFDELWDNLWFSNGSRKQTDRMLREYDKSKGMFITLKETSLESLIEQCTNKYETPEWEFPKGRRSNRENNLRCAIREFEEETDIHSNEYTVLDNVIPISEEYTGSNGVRYKHVYYFAIYKGDRDLSINKEKYEQFSEIGDIQWFTPEECYNRIRPENPTKNDIIRQVSDFMMNWNKDLILKE